MVYKDVSKLDNLCIKMDGLSSLGLAIRDCMVEGPKSAESYTDAIDLFSNLLFEFRDELNTVTKEIFSKLDKKNSIVTIRTSIRHGRCSFYAWKGVRIGNETTRIGDTICFDGKRLYIERR